MQQVVVDIDDVVTVAGRAPAPHGECDAGRPSAEFARRDLPGQPLREREPPLRALVRRAS
ncbi:hypothetical protein QFZ22_002521 [Streptomyces canus]|uniref:Uncharacterized protein n=1 Tax=Streptomyces canus TaxID=58343 RepID=A0AAW8FB81_9ACTN|nr:hypothetical protein [Streptomyces canus]MDQ0906536.1 hypothetical protein [Streptomyces canus]